MGKRQRKRDRSEATYRVVKMPVLDTGLGIEAGYASDKEMIAAAEAERAEINAMLTPEFRARLEQAEAEFLRQVIEGK